MIEKNLLWGALILGSSTLFSCGPSQRGLFESRKPAHEAYGEKIKKAGLAATEMGSLWFLAASESLASPLTITLPYKETGYFAADEPRAAGYLVEAKRGTVLNITVTTVPVYTRSLFAELWKPGDTPGSEKWLAAADSSLRLSYEVKKDGMYILRLQPELLEGIEYTLTATAGPSLAFPVSESGNPKLISFWSDPRDAGKRKHEGVDISAAFRTPAIAAADGRVQRVTDNRLGGKVVFLRPSGKEYALYYAHLDTQIVSPGQQVKTGDVIGLVGNTGNAINTVPHLHFGIYAVGGAVDPLPFINTVIAVPRTVRAPVDNINSWANLKRAADVYTQPSAKSSYAAFRSEAGSAVKILAAADDFYKVMLPSGQKGFVKSASTSSRALRVIQIDSTLRLLDRPFVGAPAKTTLAAPGKLSILGNYENYYLAEHNGIEGWVER